MPELPEVEVLRRDLEKEVVGKKIKSVEVTGARSVRRHKNKKEFIALLEGHKIVAVQRRGKYLVIRLDGPEALIVHLGMSGQLLRAKSAREKAPKHTHVAIHFTQGGLLRFVDPRTFGEMFATKYDELEEQVDELAHLGLDPLETAMSWDLFGRMLADKHARLKSLLMDQKFIAGIGNVYSDEILFQAGLKWDRMSDALSQQEIRRLYRAIFETLQDAVKYRVRRSPTSSTSTCSAVRASTSIITRCTTARRSTTARACSRSSSPRSPSPGCCSAPVSPST